MCGDHSFGNPSILRRDGEFGWLMKSMDIFGARCSAEDKDTVKALVERRIRAGGTSPALFDAHRDRHFPARKAGATDVAWQASIA